MSPIYSALNFHAEIKTLLAEFGFDRVLHKSSSSYSIHLFRSDPALNCQLELSVDRHTITETHARKLSLRSDHIGVPAHVMARGKQPVIPAGGRSSQVSFK